MKTTSSIIHWTAAVQLVLAACVDETAQPHRGAPAIAALKEGEQLWPLDFESIDQQRLPLEERVPRIGKWLVSDLDAIQEDDPNEPEHTDGQLLPMRKRRALRVSTLSTGDVLLVNGLVADAPGAGDDIGEDKARAIFEDAIAQLTSEGLDDVRGLDLNRLKVARLKQASVLQGKPETLRTELKAYMLSAPRTVNGLEVLDSEITIGVHVNGQLASFRTRGALPGIAPADKQLAEPKLRLVSSDSLRRRVESEYPEAIVDSLGLVYPVATPADASGGKAVEPQELFAVTEKLNEAEGYSRVRRIAYSVTDEKAPGVSLERQLLDDPSDPRQ